MPFKKGKPKTGGKAKGTVNKKTQVLDAFAKTICDGGAEKFKREMNKLQGKDFVNAYLQVFEYVKPKLSRMEMQAQVKATVKKVGYGKED